MQLAGHQCLSIALWLLALKNVVSSARKPTETEIHRNLHPEVPPNPHDSVILRIPGTDLHNKDGESRRSHNTGVKNIFDLSHFVTYSVVDKLQNFLINMPLPLANSTLFIYFDNIGCVLYQAISSANTVFIKMVIIVYLILDHRKTVNGVGTIKKIFISMHRNCPY